ncbi:MAG: hypothetical protein FJX75_24610 [Armatimonadetes bacterium]|nr:hypothetical protein [Armatimonadota bacterium]
MERPTDPGDPGRRNAKVTDLVQATPLERAIQLDQVAALRAALEREDGRLIDETRARLRILVGDYVPDGAENDAALRAMLRSLTRPERHGGAFYLHGLAGVGKSHMLALLGLLAESQPARDLFAATHAGLSDLCDALAHGGRLLVVMADLTAHRSQQDQLEDVLFQCAEDELGRPGYGLKVPLTELSHALSLIDRYLAPGHLGELNAAVAENVPGFESWEHLRAESPVGALRIARRIVKDVGLPIDFRQSRVERLAALLEAVRQLELDGVLWLVDGLTPFLAASNPRGIGVDFDFLSFLAQRAKIAPLWTVIAMRHSPEALAETHPYAVGQVESYAEGSFALSNSHVRQVVARRVIRKPDEPSFAEAIEHLHAAHARRMEMEPFSAAELAECYPIHPFTMRCVESVAARLFSEVSSLPAFAQAAIAGDAARGMTAGEARPYGRLVSPAEAYDYFESQIAHHPDVSVYAFDVVDYYARNSDTIAPGQQHLCLALAKALAFCRLANEAPTVAELADALFPTPEHPDLPVPEVEGLLARMRLKGRFVEVREQAGEGKNLYRVDARTTFADAARRRLAAMKATLEDSDARLREYLISVASDASLPLGELALGATQHDIEWHDTTRYVVLESVNVAALQPGDLTDRISLLSDTATLEDCAVYIGDVTHASAQRDRWLALARTLGDARWAAGLVLWAPRALTDNEMDAVKSGLACRLLLQEPGLSANPEAAGLRRRLDEERAALDQEVRTIASAAYYEGQALNSRGVVLSADELRPLRGDWNGAITAMASHALSRLFPGFPPIAPSRRLEGPAETDRLVAEFVWPGEVPVEKESPLNALIEGYARPLGLAAIDGDRWVVTADGSAVRAIMEHIRRRDTTPDHEQGPAFNCVDLALQLMKSELGLPGELSELTIAVLIRTGQLSAIDEHGVTQPWRTLTLPIRSSVKSLARSPVLRMAEWQELGRLARAILGVGVVSPNRATQQSLWEQFLQARDQYARHSARVKAQLQELSARLGHSGQRWEETRQALAALDSFFSAFDETLPAPTGLQRALEYATPYLGASGGRVQLRTLFDFAQELDDFLRGPAREILSIHAYIHDPSLTIDNHSELVRIRNRLLQYLGSGEALFRDRTQLVRTAQAFMTAYRRAYLACHAAQHRPARFEPYGTFRDSIEYQALERLSRLAIEVKVGRDAIEGILEDQVAQRCMVGGLAEALNERPTCPRCALRLDDEIRLMTVDQIREATVEAIWAYMDELRAPAIANAIAAYQESLGPESEARRALEQALALRPKARPREVLSAFTEDVIAHLNRALGGQLVHSRRLDVLAAKLVDRTLTPAEITRIFRSWLNEDGELGDSDLVVVDH